MLKNEYLVAKIGVDTAENEPSKVSGGSEFHPAVSHTDPTLAGRHRSGVASLSSRREAQLFSALAAAR